VFTKSRDFPSIENKTFKDLPRSYQDAILNYQFSAIVLRADPDNQEEVDNILREVFGRAQLGKPLSPGEKLRNIKGNMNDAITEITQHYFFELSQVDRKRNKDITLAAQLMYLTHKPSSPARAAFLRNSRSSSRCMLRGRKLR
jgi:hypothetical protein